MYWGEEAVDRHYYNGPQNVTDGSDSPQIVDHVEDNIHADYRTALQRHRRLVIDMVGWSRGAVIVATAAHDLSAVQVTSTDFVISPLMLESIDVHWVGLFDAVSQMGQNVTAPHTAWAATFSGNVHSRFHLIHTFHGTDPNYWPIKEDYLFPTVRGLTPETPFNYNMPTGSTHSDVGTRPEALTEMVENAQAAGVPVDEF